MTSRFRRFVLIAAAVALALALWIALSVGPVPELSIRTDHDPPGAELALLGAANTLTVTAREARRGVGGLRVELRQGDRSWPLAETRHPFRSAWRPWEDPPRPEETLELGVSRDTAPGLREGPAAVRVAAGRWGGLLRRPQPAVAERSFTVQLTPPSLEVLSTAHYVAQGGCEAVVYRTGATAASSGVQIGDWFFPGHPLPGGPPQERFALFAVPYDVGDVAGLRLAAVDAVGNRSERRFVDRFFERPLLRGTIQVDDRFLQRVVPDIQSRTAGLRTEGSLLDQYLAINRDLRDANRAELLELAASSRPELLWKGSFLALRGGQAMSAFAERRTYVHGGRQVDVQDHLGFDLASTSRAPVQAANDGVVLRAGWFGIYGNAVVLDHGYGLLSLYAHLSSIDVSPGETVSRGREIGRTGATGLAGGDHLHFAILLHGLPVDPREWWDDHWIRDRLGRKLGPALPDRAAPARR